MIASDVAIRLIADWLVVPIVLIAGLALLHIPKKLWYEKGARAFFAGFLALLFAKILSLVYQGQRPFVELGELPKAAYLDNPGFPSDHALFVFTITMIVWATTRRTVVGLTLLVLSALVAVGRVLALVHTPIDVIGGFVCAFLAGICVYGWRLARRSA